MRSRFNRRQDMETRYLKASRRNKVWAQPGIHQCILILDGLKPDFNIGKIIRSADAFGIREVHLVGVDHFDPEPAKGSMRWVVLRHHSDFSSCFAEVAGVGFACYCLQPEEDNILGTVPFPEKTAFIVGHEEFGISFDLAHYPAIRPLAIPQWGHVQSLNVSVAASVAMYEYTRQHGKPLEGKSPVAGEQPCEVAGRR